MPLVKFLCKTLHNADYTTHSVEENGTFRRLSAFVANGATSKRNQKVDSMG